MRAPSLTTQPPPPTRFPIRRRGQWFTLLLAISVALALAGSILLAPVPVSLDGASHVYSALVLRHLLQGDPLFSSFFRINSLLIPNWLATALLALTATASSYRWDIGFLTTLVIVWTGAALYFLVGRASRPPHTRERNLLVLVTLSPLAISGFLFQGFWGFLLSLALCLFAVGLLYGERTPANRVAVAGLILLAFWAHPVPVLLTAFFSVWIYATAFLRSLRAHHLASLTTGFLMDLAPWAVAAFLIARFAGTLVHLRLGSEQDLPQDPSASGGMTAARQFALIATRFTGLVRPDALAFVAPSRNVAGLFILFVATLMMGALLTPALASRAIAPEAPASKNDRPSLRTHLAVFIPVLLVVYLVTPDRIGNGLDISSRVLLTLLCAVAAFALSGDLASELRYLRLCASLGALITVGACAEYAIISWHFAPAVREVRSAMQRIPARSTMLLLSYQLTPTCGQWWPLLEKTRPERHWGMLGALQPELIVLNDYESATQHFPTEYKDLRFAAIENEFDFTPAETAAWNAVLENGRPADYIVSWGVPSARNGCSAWMPPPLEEDLKRTYRLESEQQHTSRVQIWGRGSEAQSAAR